jgi:hypothetical protein
LGPIPNTQSPIPKNHNLGFFKDIKQSIKC